jgi:hypothetical protein
MTEEMGCTAARGAETGSGEPLPYNVADRTRACKTNAWRKRPQEYPS